MLTKRSNIRSVNHNELEDFQVGKKSKKKDQQSTQPVRGHGRTTDPGDFIAGATELVSFMGPGLALRLAGHERTADALQRGTRMAAATVGVGVSFTTIAVKGVFALGHELRKTRGKRK